MAGPYGEGIGKSWMDEKKVQSEGIDVVFHPGMVQVSSRGLYQIKTKEEAING